MKSILIAMWLFAPLSAYAEAVMVTSVKTLTSLQAIEILSFERFSFPDGSRVKMFVLPRDHATTRSMAHKLNTTPGRFHERADRAFSSGKLNLLKIMDTDRELIREIDRTEGSIGYAQDVWACPDTAADLICLR